MNNKEAIEYGNKWDAAIESRGDTSYSEARQFLSRAIKALEWQYKMQYGDCDYCRHKNYESFKYPCTVCSNNNEMWEEEESV